MTIATTVAVPSGRKDRHGSRKNQARNNRVGQIASPVPKLNEATNPAQTTSAVPDNVRAELTPLRGRRRKARAALAITSEQIELNPPDAMIGDRAIQKLPTITVRVAMALVVRPTVSSRHTGISSSATVRSSSESPARKSGSWLPWKKRRSASQKKLGKNSEWPLCLSSTLSSQV